MSFFLFFEFWKVSSKTVINFQCNTSGNTDDINSIDQNVDDYSLFTCFMSFCDDRMWSCVLGWSQIFKFDDIQLCCLHFRNISAMVTHYLYNIPAKVSTVNNQLADFSDHGMRLRWSGDIVSRWQWKSGYDLEDQRIFSQKIANLSFYLI